VEFLLQWHAGAVRRACGLFALALMSACGGGSDATRSDLSLPTGQLLGRAPDLLISEVATNYYSDDVAWFEIYNPTQSSISLADYVLRSPHIDQSTRISSHEPIAFPLPSASVAPGAYLVIAARVSDQLSPNSQMVFVRNGSLTPYWNAHGSIELARGGLTVDFVRFGSSSATPLSAQAWRGSAVPALPSGPSLHGKSIVRLASGAMADTDTATDWTLVSFATPAGPNDVAPGVTDSDQDGIPDSAKRAGGTYAGLDLYAMGARAGRRDIFVEIDYMRGIDPALIPRREALKKVVDSFALRNVGLHIDTGALYGDILDPGAFNLGGGNPVEFVPCVELVTSGAGAREGCTSFHDYKRAHFDVRRSLVFHYALFANSLKPDGSAGSSGVAELNGNDLVVSLGGYGLSTVPGIALNMLINLQSSTLMHELGHNLGLRHGGDEAANYKPNHHSVMNYMYQFAGLSAAPNSLYAAERYYLVNGLKNKTYCNLVENSPCGSDFRIDFSDGGGVPLDENNLLEALNIGHGAVTGAYADWDNNGALSALKVARNLNPQEGSGRTVLKDFDEWGNLAIAFARERGGNNFGLEPARVNADERTRVNPMNQRARNRIVEEPLPLELQRAVRESRGKHGKQE
jgi:hypothetical protein